jgi:hypothetical protein
LRFADDIILFARDRRRAEENLRRPEKKRLENGM